MRYAIALLFAAVLASPVHARSDLTAFPMLQEECADMGGITLGPNGRWAHCKVTRGRWFATIGVWDLYQAQYCLGKSEGSCEQRALRLFANRAYTPIARLLVERIDPGTTEYDDPFLVVGETTGNIMMIVARQPGAGESRDYYRWRDDRWVALDAQAWTRELAKRLPKGVATRARVWPDIDAMSVKAPLFKTADADCCPSAGVAEVELGLSGDRFAVRKLTLVPSKR